MQPTVATSKGRILLLEPKDGAKDVRIDFMGDFTYFHDSGVHFSELPEGKWQAIGFIDEVTEGQAEKIVDFFDYKNEPKPIVEFYKGYMPDIGRYLFATGSLKSLVESLGMKGKRIYLLFETN